MINQVKINWAIQQARIVLDDVGISCAAEFGLYNLLYARGVDIILDKKINGSDARISFKDDKSVIAIDSKIKSLKRKNFILAHELAHFELHRSIMERIHLDDYNSLNSWFSGGHHEIEANYFAGEILMPEKKFKSLITDHPFSLGTLSKMSDNFESSLIATALQFSKYGNFPICIINTESGRIAWTKLSEDFPLKFIENGDPIPNNSVAGEMFYEYKNYDTPEEIESSTWFSKDFKLEEYEDLVLFEQCYKNSPTSITSILWTK